MSARRVRVYLEMLAATIIWGFAGPIIKYTLGWFDAEIFVTYRFFLTAVIGIAALAYTGFRLPKNLSTIFWLFIYSFLTSTVAIGILFLGYEETSAIDAGLISATSPMFVAIAGALFLHEKLTKRERIGLLIAFVGTGITVLEPLLHGYTGFTSGIKGNLLILLSVLIGAATAVIAKKLMRAKISASAVTHITFIVGFVTMLPFVLLTHTPTQIMTQILTAPLSFQLGAVFMALFSGTLAYYWWAKAEKTIEIGEVGIFAYLYPLFGTPLAVVWLGEKMTIPFIVGAGIITLGVITAGMKKK